MAKECKKCGLRMLSGAFGPSTHTSDGLTPWCLDCMKKYQGITTPSPAPDSTPSLSPIPDPVEEVLDRSSEEVVTEEAPQESMQGDKPVARRRRSSAFTKEDPSYYERPAYFETLKKVLKGGVHTYIWGPSGSGKSTAPVVAFKELGVEPLVMDMTRETSPDDFVGDIVRKASGETVLCKGPAYVAAEEGRPLIVEELPAAHPGSLFVLHRLMTFGKLRVTRGEGAEITAKPGFFVVATSNVLGRGDASGLYAGVQSQNEALMQRFTAIFFQDYLPEEAERNLLVRRHGIPEQAAARLVKFARSARGACEAGDISTLISTRLLLGFCNLWRLLGDPKAAAEAVFFARASADRNTLAELWTRAAPMWST